MKRLYLVGTGPGARDLTAPRALAAIADASDLVGYGGYLSSIEDLCQGKTRHELSLGQETERARTALDLAAGGSTTALISGGDVGIYAMASVVFQLIDEAGSGADNPWLNIEVDVIPGVSAMQAASSAVGALLGHDFCAISLSDLLTPWETIECRIRNAAAGDFVISFYNPVSRRRDWQLDRARDILLEHRPPATPAVIARHISRPEQSIEVIALSELDSTRVDMFTLVAVGSSQSRVIERDGTPWVYTPRGYPETAS